MILRFSLLNKQWILLIILLCAGLSLQLQAANSNDIDSPDFDDFPLMEPIENPGWFKLSFLELAHDVEEAAQAGKSGVILYFGQKRCPYCKKFLEDNFSKKDVLKYVQSKFDVIGINVRGSSIVTDFDGKKYTEKKFSILKKANFTPALLFYNAKGVQVLKLVGYQSPYRFRAAMEFVSDGHYQKESFRAYLDRAKKITVAKLGGLNKQSFFSVSPYKLDRRKVKNAKPLMVFFEQGDCHACDVLHAGPLMNFRTRKNLRHFEVVQLNRWAETKIITPTGKHSTIRRWAEKLSIDYTPTLVIFNQQGQEVIRAGSVVHFYRLNNIIRYILENGPVRFGSYRAWRSSQDTPVN